MTSMTEVPSRYLGTPVPISNEERSRRKKETLHARRCLRLVQVRQQAQQQARAQSRTYVNTQAQLRHQVYQKAQIRFSAEKATRVSTSYAAYQQALQAIGSGHRHAQVFSDRDSSERLAQNQRRTQQSEEELRRFQSAVSQVKSDAREKARDFRSLTQAQARQRRLSQEAWAQRQEAQRFALEKKLNQGDQPDEEISTTTTNNNNNDHHHHQSSPILSFEIQKTQNYRHTRFHHQLSVQRPPRVQSDTSENRHPFPPPPCTTTSATTDTLSKIRPPPTIHLETRHRHPDDNRVAQKLECEAQARVERQARRIQQAQVARVRGAAAWKGIRNTTNARELERDLKKLLVLDQKRRYVQEQRDKTFDHQDQDHHHHPLTQARGATKEKHEQELEQEFEKLFLDPREVQMMNISARWHHDPQDRDQNQNTPESRLWLDRHSAENSRRHSREEEDFDFDTTLIHDKEETERSSCVMDDDDTSRSIPLMCSSSSSLLPSSPTSSTSSFSRLRLPLHRERSREEDHQVLNHSNERPALAHTNDDDDEEQPRSNIPFHFRKNETPQIIRSTIGSGSGSGSLGQDHREIDEDYSPPVHTEEADEQPRRSSHVHPSLVTQNPTLTMNEVVIMKNPELSPLGPTHPSFVPTRQSLDESESTNESSNESSFSSRLLHRYPIFTSAATSVLSSASSSSMMMMDQDQDHHLLTNNHLNDDDDDSTTGLFGQEGPDEMVNLTPVHVHEDDSESFSLSRGGFSHESTSNHSLDNESSTMIVNPHLTNYPLRHESLSEVSSSPDTKDSTRPVVTAAREQHHKESSSMISSSTSPSPRSKRDTSKSYRDPSSSLLRTTTASTSSRSSSSSPSSTNAPSSSSYSRDQKSRTIQDHEKTRIGRREEKATSALTSRNSSRSLDSEEEEESSSSSSSDTSSDDDGVVDYHYPMEESKHEHEVMNPTLHPMQLPPLPYPSMEHFVQHHQQHLMIDPSSSSSSRQHSRSSSSSESSSSSSDSSYMTRVFAHRRDELQKDMNRLY